MRNMSFPGNTVVKNPPANAGNSAGAGGLIPGVRRSPGEGNGNPINQYSCLENPKDKGVGQFKVHGITKSQTSLSS